MTDLRSNSKPRKLYKFQELKLLVGLSLTRYPDQKLLPTVVKDLLTMPKRLVLMLQLPKEVNYISLVLCRLLMVTIPQLSESRIWNKTLLKFLSKKSNHWTKSTDMLKKRLVTWFFGTHQSQLHQLQSQNQKFHKLLFLYSKLMDLLSLEILPSIMRSKLFSLPISLQTLLSSWEPYLLMEFILPRSEYLK